VIEPTRLAILEERPPRNDADYVLYWMQQAMRAEGNLALDRAVECANELRLPLVVCFGLTGAKSPPYPDANARHYAFLLQGIAEVAETLERRGILFVLRLGSPDDVVIGLSKRAALVVCDRGYLKPQRAWQERVVKEAGCRIERVEADAVVPLDLVSTKHEFAARTIRPKIERHWEDYLVEHPAPRLRHMAGGLSLKSDVDPCQPEKILACLKLDGEVGPVRRFAGGQKAARRRLAAFVESALDGYGENRNAPEAGAVSHLSPYLHFGQISPLEIALAARTAKAPRPDRQSFLEELVVRRELAFNHVWHEPNYDAWAGLPAWARRTLGEHAKDERPLRYSRARLEAGETHDEHWNAAMREMRETGYLHNRMRMYWGKKIIEWTNSPEEAFRTALALNNRYFIDGRDANSFTNIAWLFGLHDRPWFRRPIFGTVRYMGAATLKKFDAKAWLKSVDALAEAERE
jgi:deoxyribodipyrimidine photo-lyase